MDSLVKINICIKITNKKREIYYNMYILKININTEYVNK